MVIWRGWGILTLLITAACVGLFGYVMFDLMGMEEASFFGASTYFIGFLLAGLINFVVGKKLNKDAGHHTLFFIRMEHWGLILPVIGLIMFIVFLVG